MQNQNYLNSAFSKALAALNLPSLVVSFEWPADAAHGDLATPIALVMFGQLSKDQKTNFSQPRILAEKIIVELKNQLSQINKLEDFADISVAGPGFINLTFSKSFLMAYLRQQVTTMGNFTSAEFVGRKMMVEFTDPNPFKEFHIGHLYSNIVGESLSRIFQALGADVHRACYQGDVGMHVAKSIWGMMKLMETENLSVTELAKQSLVQRVNFMGRGYAQGAAAFEAEPDSVEEMKQINAQVFISSQERLKQLGKEPQVNYHQLLPAKLKFDQAVIDEIYLAGREWSLAYFDQIYARLGTKFDSHFFESETAEEGLQIVHEYLQKGVFEESQGAVIFPGKKYGLHDRVFINSLGLPTYEAKDLGLAPAKFAKWPYDESYIVTANEVNTYFQVVLKALSIIRPDLAAKTKHYSHGMIKLPEGKMSSRTGNVLTGEWLLNTVKETVASREGSAELSDATIEAISQAAIKFVLLRNSLGNDQIFDINQATSLVGNTGPYVQYSAVRALNVTKKGGLNPDALSDIAVHIDTLLNNKVENELLHDYEILRYLKKYSDTVRSAGEQKMPHIICSYLTELASRFNAYYDQCPVLSADEPIKSVRLLICWQVWTTLKHGLNLIGIQTVERM